MRRILSSSTVLRRLALLSTMVSIAVAAAFLLPARASDPVERRPDDESGSRLESQFEELLRLLDDDRYYVREEAAAQAETLLARQDHQIELATLVARALRDTKVSYEVRWHLQRWSERLPEPLPDRAPRPSPGEIDALVTQLDADDFSVRAGAAQRLEWLLGDGHSALPILERVKQRLADPELSAPASRRVEEVWRKARGAWLQSDPATRELAPLTDEQIARWVDDLAQPGEARGLPLSHPQRVAERELLDALARDADVTRIAESLRGRLERPIDVPASARLQNLLELTQPALVAEYWDNRQHLGEQHLIVGRPSQSPNAARPSHFDRIDDQTAHCVSGNTLTPGDYPASVAFPHPIAESAFFHLVNLPNPRRRMAYTYYVQTADAPRLAAISRRTLSRFLAEDRPLTESELVMLAELDPAEVSSFASQHLRQVEDSPLPGPPTRERIGSRPSRLGFLCAQLARDGTKAAVPGLLEAIEKRRFLPPTSMGPYRMHLVAALSIASRDPWSEVNTWLAAQVPSHLALAEDQRENGAELGATAAAILVLRHKRSVSEFGLLEAPDPVLMYLNVRGYRFGSPDDPQRVLEWWKTCVQQQRQP